MKYLIAGLGNIGAEYEFTRHNIGFEVVNEIAKRLEVSFDIGRLSFHAEAKYKGRTLHLIKPTTYMNLSGKAVAYWKKELKLEETNIMIVTDDLSLPFGKLRLRGKGSDGGHNGLKSINELLQTSKYPRLRFGIGDNFSKGRQVDYVLNKWSVEEQKDIDTYIQTAADAILSYTAIGLERTMNVFNTK
jgi:PTH1 family peptidyl-tRNA hydrolase